MVINGFVKVFLTFLLIRALRSLCCARVLESVGQVA